MFLSIKDLKVYQLSRQLSSIAWSIYATMPYEDKKHIGDQFLRSTDSVGANIAEGYARFHYLDKCKFYYNSRASLSEANDHWLELLLERNKIEIRTYEVYKSISKDLQIRLNNFIKQTKNEKEQIDK
ncbi:MAG: four helix bundle protein [Breznakibacter sp.]|nr:four helix bundle protein [Breznakibacter sp.]